MTQEAIEISTTPPLPGLKLVQDVNKALQTIATDFAGPTDPAGLPGCGPYCTWADTANGLRKRRNAANSAWEVEGELFMRSANRNGDPTQDFAAKIVTANGVAASSFNGGQLAGFRNKILNGRFNVNQKGAGSRAGVPGEYNFDQWYFDGTYLYQPIPSEDIFDGEYTLSWDGPSTAEWSLNGAFSNAQGSQTYTPIAKGGQIVVSGHTNQHLWVRFQGDLGQLNKVQLEPGSKATPYEDRFLHQELALCQRFYERGRARADAYANTSGQACGGSAQFIASKRVTPTISASYETYINVDGQNFSASPSTNGFTFVDDALAAGKAAFVFVWEAKAQI